MACSCLFFDFDGFWKLSSLEEDSALFRSLLTQTSREFFAEEMSSLDNNAAGAGRTRKEEEDSLVFESSGRSWPKSFARSIGLVQTTGENALSENILAQPLLFSSVPSASGTEYSECQSWYQIENGISGVLERETKRGKRRAIEAIEDEPEEIPLDTPEPDACSAL